VADEEVGYDHPAERGDEHPEEGVRLSASQIAEGEPDGEDGGEAAFVADVPGAGNVDGEDRAPAEDDPDKAGPEPERNPVPAMVEYFCCSVKSFPNFCRAKPARRREGLPCARSLPAPPSLPGGGESRLLYPKKPGVAGGRSRGVI
jgi:hypothetical protein